jgi:hypothetical protein
LRLGHQADVTDCRDSKDLHFRLDIIVIQDIEQDLSYFVKIVDQLHTEDICQVLDKPCSSSLTEYIKGRLLILTAPVTHG